MDCAELTRKLGVYRHTEMNHKMFASSLSLAIIFGLVLPFSTRAVRQTHINKHLDLTPFVRSGDYASAQAAAAVQLPNDPLNLTSYSGFIETTPGRHMFM